MAQYNVSSQIAELDSAAIASLVDANRIVEQLDGGELKWYAWGNKGFDAVERAVAEARRPAQVEFTKHNGSWAVSVPAGSYAEGAQVEIVKRDGSRKPAVLGAKLADRDGRVIAAFSEPSKSNPAAEAYRIGYAHTGMKAQIWDNA